MALTDNIVAYYKFDENTGSTAGDSVGSNNGTITGASWVTGKINSGLEFTGSDADRVVVSSSVGFPTGNNERSVNMWINPDTYSNGQEKFFSVGTASDGEAIDLTIEEISSTGCVLIRHFGGNIRFPGITTGSRQMVTMVVPSGATTTDDIKIYIDGTEVTGIRNAGSDQTLNTASSNIYIGNSITSTIPNSQSFDGKMDEVGLRSRALSSSEITELYNSGAGLQYPFTTANTTNFFMVM